MNFGEPFLPSLAKVICAIGQNQSSIDFRKKPLGTSCGDHATPATYQIAIIFSRNDSD
jgi:hypothetical protein